MHKKIYAKSLAYYFKNELKNKELISDVFYNFASYANGISIPQFDNAIDYQNKISRSLDKDFESFDILISLSTANPAPLRNETELDDPSLIWTMCGVPTINIPFFKTSQGLPIGIQVIARKYNDKLLLQFVKFLRQLNLINDGPYPQIKL
jgi:Asp-tRNA(Asn)/Glu-tRNA(Gln) amidotransferase A subunit family amidase